MLEQEGKTVTVLEARVRVGGRIWTLLDQPGYPEMGFNSMAAG
jgi:monoamine oxidase